MRFSVMVETRLHEGIADPEGATIERALPALGFDGVSGMRVGKCFRFDVEADDAGTARAEIDDMCKRFLTNPVLEAASVTIDLSPESDGLGGAETAQGGEAEG